MVWDMADILLITSWKSHHSHGGSPGWWDRTGLTFHDIGSVLGLRAVTVVRPSVFSHFSFNQLFYLSLISSSSCLSSVWWNSSQSQLSLSLVFITQNCNQSYRKTCFAFLKLKVSFKISTFQCRAESRGWTDIIAFQGDDQSSPPLADIFVITNCWCLAVLKRPWLMWSLNIDQTESPLPQQSRVSTAAAKQHSGSAVSKCRVVRQHNFQGPPSTQLSVPATVNSN